MSNKEQAVKKRLKRRRLLTYTGMAVIVLGLLLILFALGLRACTGMEQDSYIQQYLAEETQGGNADASFSPSAPSETILPDTEKILNDNGTDDKGKNSDSKKDMELLGVLEIPKLNLKVAIGEGVDRRTLRYTVGHFPFTVPPGAEGNCCIIGHRSYLFGMFFNRLNELNAGDKINVRYKGKDYTYEVTEQQVVKPSDIWVLNPTAEAQLTLVTCTPVRIATHRLIIRAKLI
jgi:sortase A